MGSMTTLEREASDMIFTIGYLSNFADKFEPGMPDTDKARVFMGFQNLCTFAAIGLLWAANDDHGEA